MTYFDPEVYNKNNLSPNDKAELAFWENMIVDAIDTVRADCKCLIEKQENPIRKAQWMERLEGVELLEEQLRCTINEIIVSYIENYSDEEFEQYSGDRDVTV